MRRVKNTRDLLEYNCRGFPEDYLTFTFSDKLCEEGKGRVRVVSTIVSLLTPAQARHIAKWLTAAAERIEAAKEKT